MKHAYCTHFPKHHLNLFITHNKLNINVHMFVKLHSNFENPKKKFVGGTSNCENFKPYNEKTHIDLCCKICALRSLLNSTQNQVR